MLYQTDIYTMPADISGVYSEISVKLHGAVMNMIPSAFAGELHSDSPHPFSIFTVPAPDGSFIIRVSALTDEAEMIAGSLANAGKINIFGMKKPLIISHASSAPPISAADAEKYVSKKCRAEMITPATVRKNGRFSGRPELALYFQSVIKKYNLFENADLDFNDFKAAFEKLNFGGFSLNSAVCNISGHRMDSVKGNFKVSFPDETEENIILRKIFAYASYSGIGGKTSMGMGGFTVTNL